MSKKDKLYYALLSEIQRGVDDFNPFNMSIAIDKWSERDASNYVVIGKVFDDLLGCCEETVGARREDIMSKNRKHSNVMCRDFIMFALRIYFEIPPAMASEQLSMSRFMMVSSNKKIFKLLEQPYDDECERNK